MPPGGGLCHLSQLGQLLRGLVQAQPSTNTSVREGPQAMGTSAPPEAGLSYPPGGNIRGQRRPQECDFMVTG